MSEHFLCCFDREGAVYKAAQYRQRFSIKEFAEFLADYDPERARLNGINDYDRVVQPWIDVFVDLVREEYVTPDFDYVCTLGGYRGLELNRGDISREYISEMTFPVKAFKGECERMGLPYPFDTVFKPIPLPKADQALEVVEGVTVTDIQKMCERSTAFHSVLKTVAIWQNIEKENPERMTEEALRAKLRIAARNDKWGSNKGELSPKTQADPIVKLILGSMRAGGRPKK